MNSKIEVYRFEESDSIKWDEFVDGSYNGTMFHTRTFLSYHPQDRFRDHSLYFQKKEKKGKKKLKLIRVSSIIYSREGETT